MRIRTRFGALVAVVLFAAASLPAGGQSGTCSRAGCPDSDFGTNGIVRLPSFGGAIGAIAIQHIDHEDLFDKDHVVALNTSTGSWKLTRYHFTPGGANVTVDTTFGISGVVTKPLSGFVVTASIGIAVQPDNNYLVVAGGVRATKRGAQDVLTIVRYTADGQEDSTFGKGGTVSLPRWSTATEPRLQSDGKILLAIPVWTNSVPSSVVVRLNEFGALDPGFGENGIATIEGFGSARALAVQLVGGQEKILLATGIPTASDGTRTYYSAGLVRLDENGSRDWTFGENQGATVTSLQHPDGPTKPTSMGFSDITIDADGRIVCAGNGSYQSDGAWVVPGLAARYDSGGLPDAGFADGGVVIAPGPDATIRDVLTGLDGKVLLVGYPTPTDPYKRGLILWRLQENGVADPSFGTDGLMATIVTQDPMSSMWPGLDVGPGSCTHAAFLSSGSTFLVGGSAYTPNSKRVYTAVGALGRFHY